VPKSKRLIGLRLALILLMPPLSVPPTSATRTREPSARPQRHDERPRLASRRRLVEHLVGLMAVRGLRSESCSCWWRAAVAARRPLNLLTLAC
jgi:hypothetical protein